MLLDWCAVADQGRGIRFWRREGWDHFSYHALARLVSGASSFLADAGVGPGTIAFIVMPPGPELVALFFGTLAVGATPSVLAPPQALQDRGAWAGSIERMTHQVQPSLVVTTPALGEWVHQAGTDLRTVTVDIAELEGRASGSLIFSPSESPALLQFSSGSSGNPKALVISAQALDDQIAAIRRWLRMGRDDGTATWLPLYHDMGLVGCFLAPIVNGSNLDVMEPKDFVRSPRRWLSCFDDGRASLSAAPTFGLRHILRRVKPEHVAGLDLSDWRALILGAERIDLEVLKGFTTLLAPAGFNPRALRPAYGLAEATLAVTGLGVDLSPTSITIDRRSLIIGCPVVQCETDDPYALSLIGCGSPLGDFSVVVADSDGRPVEPGVFGTIVLDRATMADARVTADGHVEWLPDAGYDTGDSGFLYDGQLYVVGRLGDSLKNRGTIVFAEDLESLAADTSGDTSASPVVLLGTLQGSDVALVVTERGSPAWAEEVIAALVTHLEGITIRVLRVSRGAFLRTSSGKPRRRAMWDHFTCGLLGGEELAFRSASSSTLT